MCKKAEEIQPKDALGWIGGIHQGGNIYYHTSSIYQQERSIPSGFYYLMNEVNEDENGEQHHRQIKAIWLPRQDQLQERVQFTSPAHLLEHLNSWIMTTERGLFPALYNTMEQLWLAFVMKEKYNKIWTGEEWIESNGM